MVDCARCRATSAVLSRGRASCRREEEGIAAVVDAEEKSREEGGGKDGCGDGLEAE